MTYTTICSLIKARHELDNQLRGYRIVAMRARVAQQVIAGSARSNKSRTDALKRVQKELDVLNKDLSSPIRNLANIDDHLDLLEGICGVLDGLHDAEAAVEHFVKKI